MYKKAWEVEDREEIKELREFIDIILKRMSMRAFDKDQRIRLTLIEIIDMAAKELRRLNSEYARQYNSTTC